MSHRCLRVAAPQRLTLSLLELQAWSRTITDINLKIIKRAKFYLPNLKLWTLLDTLCFLCGGGAASFSNLLWNFSTLDVGWVPFSDMTFKLSSIYFILLQRDDQCHTQGNCGSQISCFRRRNVSTSGPRLTSKCTHALMRRRKRDTYSSAQGQKFEEGYWLLLRASFLTGTLVFELGRRSKVWWHLAITAAKCLSSAH